MVFEIRRALTAPPPQLDTDEVTVGRRLFRDGTSDIN